LDIKIVTAKEKDLTFVDSLQRKNTEELSFYPKSAFDREVQNRRIILALVNDEPAGYLYHGALNSFCKIHQACITYDLRGQLYGAELVRNFLNQCEAFGVMTVTLRCGSDIEANGFWKAMGFYCEAVAKGGVRRMRDINCWRIDLEPSLFKISVTESQRKKDSSIWRKRNAIIESEKSIAQHHASNRFLRGKALQNYRVSLEKKFNYLNQEDD
jgi:N-acetylglutamate synthase-like GNAT family acetyltransferase